MDKQVIPDIQAQRDIQVIPDPETLLVILVIQAILEQRVTPVLLDQPGILVSRDIPVIRVLVISQGTRDTLGILDTPDQLVKLVIQGSLVLRVILDIQVRGILQAIRDILVLQVLLVIQAQLDRQDIPGLLGILATQVPETLQDTLVILDIPDTLVILVLLGLRGIQDQQDIQVTLVPGTSLVIPGIAVLLDLLVLQDIRVILVLRAIQAILVIRAH